MKCESVFLLSSVALCPPCLRCVALGSCHIERSRDVGIEGCRRGKKEKIYSVK